jgi:hypothetical protein
LYELLERVHISPLCLIDELSILDWHLFGIPLLYIHGIRPPICEKVGVLDKVRTAKSRFKPLFQRKTGLRLDYAPANLYL